MPDNAVTLRITEPDDYRYFEIWWNTDTIADACRDTLETLTNGQIDTLFHNASDTDDDHQFGRTVLDPHGQPIGHIAAWGCTDPERDATMALLIGPYYQGLGFGNQAMKLGIKLAVEQLHASTITVNVWSFNLRARHMAESFGLKEVSRRNDAVERDGHAFDEVTYRAPVEVLLQRISSEEVERREGEELERRRFASDRSADLLSVF